MMHGQKNIKICNLICVQYLSLNNLPKVRTGDSYLAAHKSLASDRLGDFVLYGCA